MIRRLAWRPTGYTFVLCWFVSTSSLVSAQALIPQALPLPPLFQLQAWRLPHNAVSMASAQTAALTVEHWQYLATGYLPLETHKIWLEQLPSSGMDGKVTVLVLRARL